MQTMSDVMDYLLTVAGLDKDTIKLAKKAGVKKFIHFGVIHLEKLETALVNVGMDVGDTFSVLALQRYYLHWRALENRGEIEEHLNPTTWDDWVETIAQEQSGQVTKPLVTASSQPPTTVPNPVANLSVRKL